LNADDVEEEERNAGGGEDETEVIGEKYWEE
jgi:hypothetical protein